jgi:hypothetical protein
LLGYNKVQGSLSLGGYDASRFATNNVTFQMYEDVARRFIVNLGSINIPASNTSLLSASILVYIDSTLPYLYLPLDVCNSFGEAFDLVWNSTDELYFFNNPSSAGANLTFTLSNNAGDTVNIYLPFDAFNLTASAPLLDSSRQYLPLKRAANDTQYTLGRTFLQEA